MYMTCDVFDALQLYNEIFEVARAQSLVIGLLWCKIPII